MAEVVVRPRARSPESGETLLLEDLLEPHLRPGATGAICLQGGWGSGKSTALQYLQGRLPPGTMAVLLDDPSPGDVSEHRDRMLVIYAAAAPFDLPHRAVLRLTPWGIDEALESLQGSPNCAVGLDLVRRHGTPEPAELASLWLRCLRDGRFEPFEPALLAHFEGRVGRGWRRRLGAWFLERLYGEPSLPPWPRSWWERLWLGRPPGARHMRLALHRLVRLHLAAVELIRRLRTRNDHRALSVVPPPEFLDVVGPRLAVEPEALHRLRERMVSDARVQPAAASLLFAADSQWQPGKTLTLEKGRFPGATWADLDLSQADLRGADLRKACLSKSSLNGADLVGADLSGAKLRESGLALASAKGIILEDADLSGTAAAEADFSHGILRGARFDEADLRQAWFKGADLRRASFREARLLEAVLHEAKLDGADLRDADLTRASLRDADLRSTTLRGALLTGANMNGARLDHVRWPEACLQGARLSNASLTGSSMPQANLNGADLRWSQLGDIAWPGADLRDADLEGAQFHFGTSRSGKLFGGPSQGTRTGFYTDEYHERHYRSPDEIRVADLRGCDLRGAHLAGVDFYRVDLRGARIDEDQRPHLLKTGAIL